MTEPTKFLPGDLFADDLYCNKSLSTDFRFCVSSEQVISYLFVRTDVKNYRRLIETFQFGTAHHKSDIGELIYRAE